MNTCARKYAPASMELLYHSRPQHCFTSMNDSARASELAPATPHIDGRGLAAAVSAFLIWGFLPLYLKVLQMVPVVQFTAHRLAWGFLFGFGWLLVRGEAHQTFRALGDSQTRNKLCLSAALIAVNWWIFMWGTANHHVVEVSLGYFIAPLLNVALGVVCFRERLNRAQTLAVVIAAAGVIYLTWSAGRPPWLSIGLALSFGMYGLVRKVAKVEALPGFTGETLLLFPFAAGYILWCELSGQGVMTELGWGMNIVLLLSGPMTAVPLVLFAVGARRIPLSTVGLLQYIAPTMQLLTAVFLFHEAFTSARVVGFSMIWAALAIYGMDGLIASRRREQTAS
jgi:chloramphenicol-sensitive protein RarD